MPRAKKAQSNQHNSRHENGIVAPGKRVAKQKSNGHLNGSVDDSARSTPSSLLHPTTACTTARGPETGTSSAPTKARHTVHPAESLVNGSRVDSTAASTGLMNSIPQVDSTQKHPQREMDRNAAKSPVFPRDSIFNLALTILRACPLGDTIAILLVLLWLPPTLLTVTNALFAVLTFMPPIVTIPAFPTTLNDLFVGSGNTPSLATVFLTDIIGLVLWLVIWTPVQTLAVELAQAVIATTLGGGGCGKKRGSDSTMFCMSIVTINHVVRHDWLPRQILGFDWPAILSKIPFVSKNPLSFPSNPNSNDDLATRSPAGWIRVLIALHILIQGLVHVARRWYQKREFTQPVSISKTSGLEPIPRTLTRSSNVPAADGSQALMTSSPDGIGKVHLPKDSRDKVSSGKKKRRQSALARSQQPLWAAFAATKVTILREFEQSQALKEVASSQAVDVNNLGSARFAAEGDRVWAFDVQPNSFRFRMSLFTRSENLVSEADASHELPQPFRVRINDMDWASAKIEKQSEEAATEQWSGEIFGLSPTSSYRCSLIRNEDDLVVYSATITTPPSDFTKNERSVPSTEVSRQSYRPSSPKSPTTTLQKSIAAFEASLNESQARQKRLKKDIKAGAANLKRELDVLNSKISKLGGEDKAHTNRHMQWNQLTRQADDAVVTLSSEIELLGSIPEEDLKQSKETKAVCDEVRSAQTFALGELLRSKDEVHKVSLIIRNEETTSQQKRERLQARKTKLQDQYERLRQVTAHGIDEKQRKNSEQVTKDLERFQTEQSYNEQLQALVQAVHEARFNTQRIRHQHAVEAAFHQRQMMENAAPPEIERPLTPEGDLPGTNPQNAVSHASRVPTFGSVDSPITGLRSHSGSLRHSVDVRPRSTSGLPTGSIFDDFDDQDPAPPLPTRAVEVIRERGQMHSRNSGHGSGSSGSQRDPSSPVGGYGVQASPMGKRSPVWNP